MTHLAFLQEYDSVWTGTSVNSIVKDEVLLRSRKLKHAEFEHCGDSDCFYILTVDIARESGQLNARTAMEIIKLTPITDKDNPENYSKFWKDIVYIQSFEGVDHTTQAKYIKEFVDKFAPYIVVIDANSYGMAIRDELMKDLGDGFPPYGVINDDRQAHLRQAGAVDILYALKSNTVEDPDKELITYAEIEFENGRVRLLCDSRTGLLEYKKKHRIKDDYQDNEIISPYTLTDELCDEISNLVKLTEGHSVKEKRVSSVIPRDKWSALKYGLRMAQYKELELMAGNNDSGWGERFNRGAAVQEVKVKAARQRPSVRKRSNGVAKLFS